MSSSPTHRRRRRTRLVVAGALTVPALVAPLAASAAATSDPSGAAGAESVRVFRAASATAAGLQHTVDAYRAVLGTDNGSGPPAASGRREINWDAVPDALSAPGLLPPDTFNTAVPRGAVFASPAGDRFQVSADADNPTHTPVEFGNLNPRYPWQFSTFSPEKLFTPLGTTSTTVKFFVPGTQQRASVEGFGAVFTDVDRWGGSSIAYYDRWGHLITRQSVPRGPKAAGSLSFLGVESDTPVYEVRITSGNAPLSRWNVDRAHKDVVALDDFIYGEPRR